MIRLVEMILVIAAAIATIIVAAAGLFGSDHAFQIAALIALSCLIAAIALGLVEHYRRNRIQAWENGR